MNLTRQLFKVIGYESPNCGVQMWDTSEHHTPLSLRVHDIVETGDGPRTVVGISKSGVYLALVGKPDEAVAQ